MPDHPAYATTLNLLAQQLWFEGDLLASKDASERAVAVAERTLRPDHPTVALSLRYLADTLIDLGDLPIALPLTGRALAIAERTFGASHHVTAEYVHSLGTRRTRPRELSSSARASSSMRWPSTRLGTANGTSWWPRHTTVSRCADARLGDYRQRRAGAIPRRRDPYAGRRAQSPLCRAGADRAGRRSTSRRAGRRRRCRCCIARSRFARRTSARTIATSPGRSLIWPRRSPQSASRLAPSSWPRERCGIWERLDAPDAPEFATVLALYAKLQANRGDAAAAREYYERALAIRGKVFGPVTSALRRGAVGPGRSHWPPSATAAPR